MFTDLFLQVVLGSVTCLQASLYRSLWVVSKFTDLSLQVALVG